MFAQLASAAPLASRVSARPARVSNPARLASAMRANNASSASQTAESFPSHLHVPAERDARYGGNIAQYLLDLDDAPGATFNFCGGMMFGLSLSPKLRAHLIDVAASGESDPRQPIVYPQEVRRMSMRPDGHSLDATADNVRVFHGREVRRVPWAPGGGGMVIHLSFAGEPSADDPEGWTREEVNEYAGWLSDRQRRWRDGSILLEEGFEAFRERFGPEAFTLHHRFYLHVDAADEFWLAAEDGCEGVAQEARPRARDFGAAARSLFR